MPTQEQINKHRTLCKRLQNAIRTNQDLDDPLSEILSNLATIEDNSSITINLFTNSREPICISEHIIPVAFELTTNGDHESGLIIKSCQFQSGAKFAGNFKRGIKIENTTFDTSLVIQGNVSDTFCVVGKKETNIARFDISSLSADCETKFQGIKINEFHAHKITGENSFHIKDCVVEKTHGPFVTCAAPTHLKIRDSVFKGGVVQKCQNLRRLDLKDCILDRLRLCERGEALEGIQIRGGSVDVLSINNGAAGKELIVSNSQIASIEMKETSWMRVRLDSLHKIPNGTAIEIGNNVVIRDVEIFGKGLKSLHVNGAIASLRVVVNLIHDFALSPGISLGRVLIESTTFNHFRALGVKFQEQTDIRHCRFIEAPKFFGAKFDSKGASFVGSKFKDIKSSHAEAAYRELKAVMLDIKNESEAQRFHGKETHARRRLIKESDTFEWCLSWLYFGINNYGANLWLPFAWLFALLVLCCTFYSTQHGLLEIPEGITANSLGWYTSLVNTLGPLRLLPGVKAVETHDLYMRLFFLGQGLSATILWFFGIFGIRKAFKT